MKILSTWLTCPHLFVRTSSQVCRSSNSCSLLSTPVFHILLFVSVWQDFLSAITRSLTIYLPRYLVLYRNSIPFHRQISAICNPSFLIHSSCFCFSYTKYCCSEQSQIPSWVHLLLMTNDHKCNYWFCCNSVVSSVRCPHILHRSTMSHPSQESQFLYILSTCVCFFFLHLFLCHSFPSTHIRRSTMVWFLPPWPQY